MYTAAARGFQKPTVLPNPDAVIEIQPRILPPLIKALAGRPAKRRKTKENSTQKCTRCGQIEHNRKTCRSSCDGRGNIISTADNQKELQTAFIVKIEGGNETVLPQSEEEAKRMVELDYDESVESYSISESNQVYQLVSFEDIDGGLYDAEDVDAFTGRTEVNEFLASGSESDYADNNDVAEGSSNSQHTGHSDSEDTLNNGVTEGSSSSGGQADSDINDEDNSDTEEGLSISRDSEDSGVLLQLLQGLAQSDHGE